MGLVEAYSNPRPRPTPKPTTFGEIHIAHGSTSQREKRLLRQNQYAAIRDNNDDYAGMCARDDDEPQTGRMCTTDHAVGEM